MSFHELPPELVSRIATVHPGAALKLLSLNSKTRKTILCDPTLWTNLAKRFIPAVAGQLKRPRKIINCFRRLAYGPRDLAANIFSESTFVETATVYEMHPFPDGETALLDSGTNERPCIHDLTDGLDDEPIWELFREGEGDCVLVDQSVHQWPMRFLVGSETMMYLYSFNPTLDNPVLQRAKRRGVLSSRYTERAQLHGTVSICGGPASYQIVQWGDDANEQDTVVSVLEDSQAFDLHLVAEMAIIIRVDSETTRRVTLYTLRDIFGTEGAVLQVSSLQPIRELSLPGRFEANMQWVLEHPLDGDTYRIIAVDTSAATQSTVYFHDIDMASWKIIEKTASAEFSTAAASALFCRRVCLFNSTYDAGIFVPGGQDFPSAWGGPKPEELITLVIAPYTGIACLAGPYGDGCIAMACLADGRGTVPWTAGV